jgi:hypothetical protein
MKKDIITKADNGNSIFVIKYNKYHENILDFINNDNFNTMTGDFTNKFQKEIRGGINN